MYDDEKSRILSSSLDGLIKIYDPADFRLLHSIHYPSPIMNFTITKNNRHLVVGMSDGKFSVRVNKNKEILKPR